jgi:ATP-dependent Zn protease
VFRDVHKELILGSDDVTTYLNNNIYKKPSTRTDEITYSEMKNRNLNITVCERTMQSSEEVFEKISASRKNVHHAYKSIDDSFTEVQHYNIHPDKSLSLWQVPKGTSDSIIIRESYKNYIIPVAEEE